MHIPPAHRSTREEDAAWEAKPFPPLEKYPMTGRMQRGWFVDADSTQLPRGRVGLFYGFTGEDGTPDRTMSAQLVRGADSIEELMESHPEAFAIDITELRMMVVRETRERERCPVCGGLNPGDITHTRC